jgi:hypothetical protein
MRTSDTGNVQLALQTHLDTLRLIPQRTSCGPMLVQLLRQVGDDSPQPHHLLVVVLHDCHRGVSDLSQRVSSLEGSWCAKGYMEWVGGERT